MNSATWDMSGMSNAGTVMPLDTPAGTRIALQINEPILEEENKDNGDDSESNHGGLNG